MLLIDFFETVYIPRRLRGCSQNSVRLYRLCISQFCKTLGREALVADLTEDNVLRHLARRSCVMPATRNKELNQLRALWRLASRLGYHSGEPDIKDEPEPERAPVAWLAEEVQALLNSAASQPGKIGDIPAAVWWSALVRVILDSGERISAVRDAQWSWLCGHWLTVPAEARKKKTRDRKYLLNSETLDTLGQLRRCSQSQAMFPWPYTPTYLWTKYNSVLKSASLPCSRIHKFHACRKTLCSVVYASGMDPQDAMDHTDRRTTQRYIDARFSRERQPSEILADFLSDPTLREKSLRGKRKSG